MTQEMNLGVGFGRGRGRGRGLVLAAALESASPGAEELSSYRPSWLSSGVSPPSFGVHAPAAPRVLGRGRGEQFASLLAGTPQVSAPPVRSNHLQA